MKEAYLFAWNPTQRRPESLADEVQELQENGTVTMGWRSGKRLSIPVGSRAFMIKLGSPPKGIIGMGITRTEPQDAPPWLEIEFEVLSETPLISWEDLHRPPLRPSASRIRTGSVLGTWSIRASGVILPAALTDRLERLLKPFAGSEHAKVKHPRASDAEHADELFGLEGALRRRMVVHRKREQRLRAAKIAQAIAQNKGCLVCEVPGCEFDFSRVYGALGAGYAQVHHLHPLGDSKKVRSTRLKDLAIVCANCHAMIHRNGECRPLERLVAHPSGARAK